MKTPHYLSLPILGLTLATSQAAVYTHTFNEGTGTLDGVAVDSGGANWLAENIDANGTTSNSGGAVLPYNFGSGQYEVTADISRTGADSTGLASIYFTTSNPLEAGYFTSSSVGAYGVFALRINGDFEIWGGLANSNNVDGGDLTDYGFDLRDDVSGQLRMLLDTTGSSWTIDGFFTPNGESEAQIDLNGATAGNTYTFDTNPSSFTGAGITWSGTSTTYNNFTLDVIPEPSASALLGIGFAALLMRKRR